MLSKSMKTKRMNAKQDGGFNLHGWKKLTKIRLLKAAEGFNPKYQQCNWLHYIFFINSKLHRLFQSPCSSFLSISSEFKSVFPSKLQENQFHFINFILSNFIKSISSNQFCQINFIKSILSNQFHFISFILSVSFYQFHLINFILSISFYQFYFINLI